MCFSFIFMVLIALMIWATYLDIEQKHKYISEVCSLKIKKAMTKMGPCYHYKILGEKLYVDKGNGKWLRLDYEREE